MLREEYDGRGNDIQVLNERIQELEGILATQVFCLCVRVYDKSESDMAGVSVHHVEVKWPS